MFIYILAATIAALFQSVFIPLNLTVLILVGAFGYFESRYWPLAAFIIGIIFDLFSGRSLGISSLIFLGAVFFCWLYSRKWSIAHPLILLIVTVITDLVGRRIWGETIVWRWVLLDGGLAALWGWWLKNTGGVGIRLKV